MKSIKILKPFLETLDTGNIGHIVAVGICYAVFKSSYVTKSVLIWLFSLLTLQLDIG